MKSILALVVIVAASAVLGGCFERTYETSVELSIDGQYVDNMVVGYPESTSYPHNSIVRLTGGQVDENALADSGGEMVRVGDATFEVLAGSSCKIASESECDPDSCWVMVRWNGPGTCAVLGHGTVDGDYDGGCIVSGEFEDPHPSPDEEPYADLTAEAEARCQKHLGR